MSTDIVHWDSNERTFQSAALITYLYVSLPSTAIVLAFWALMQLYEKIKEDRKRTSEDEKIKRLEP